MRKCDAAEMCEMRRFWQVGIAETAVFFHSFVASPARKVSSLKRAGAEGRLPKTSPKFAPRCGARAIWKSKLLKHQGFGPFCKVRRFFAWQGQGFRQSIHIKIAKTYCNSEAQCLVNMLFLKEVPQKSCS